ncbi:hypothetical protein [Parasphingorhabdus pacifica]
MTPEEEREFIATVTSPEHTRLADADQQRRMRNRTELDARGLIPQGLKDLDEKPERR